MKRNKIFALAFGCIALCSLPACQEDANDWGFDEEHNRLFRSTSFELVKEEPTSVLLSFKGVSNATKYIFDFSQGDSLLFDNIVSTRELLADTMTAYRQDVSAVNTEYRMLFDNLNGTTRYSVRMKAVDEKNGMESGYSQLFFITPDEQIFTKVTPGTTIASLKWKADKEATTIKYALLEGENQVDTTWFEPHTLTAAEKAAGAWTIEGLTLGTKYLAQIFNGEVRRGSYPFTTLGAKNGTLIEVQPSDNINEVLATASGEVTLSFMGGETYTVGGRLNIPATVSSLYLAGNAKDGVLPKLLIGDIGLAGPMERFAVQYLEFAGDNAGFMTNLGGVNIFKNASFEGCYIHDIRNCLVRISTDDADVETVEVKDCILERISTSGWGIFNLKARSFKKLSMTNSTLVDIYDQICDVSIAIDEVEFTNLTHVNYIELQKWLRFNKQPKGITVTGVIFAGDMGGKKINSGYGDYAGWLNFAGCYLTSDFTVNKRPFNDAKILDITTDELFVDPKNGDFHFRPEAKFEGDGKVGDPRWWTE